MSTDDEADDAAFKRARRAVELVAEKARRAHQAHEREQEQRQRARSAFVASVGLQARYNAATPGVRPGAEGLNMSDTPLSLRIPDSILARADELIPLLADDPDLSMIVGGKMTRSTVLRVAILRGIKALEADFIAPKVTAE
jgi:putative intracellular protease/amidase